MWQRSRLHELSEHGVSVWIDSLSREMLETGELKRLIHEDAVVGVTSNPTIFEKALSTGDWYDEQLRAELERTDDTKEVFFALAVEDIERACDSSGRSGSGRTASTGSSRSRSTPISRTSGTRPSSRRSRSRARRPPNLYVKIPATAPGVGAIEDSIAAGRSINVTLIFSLERHAAVAEAYVRGLERLVEAGAIRRTSCP